MVNVKEEKVSGMTEFGSFNNNLEATLDAIWRLCPTKKGRNFLFERIAGLVASSMNLAAEDENFRNPHSNERYDMVYRILQERSL